MVTLEFSSLRNIDYVVLRAIVGFFLGGEGVAGNLFLIPSRSARKVTVKILSMVVKDTPTHLPKKEQAHNFTEHLLFSKV